MVLMESLDYIRKNTSAQHKTTIIWMHGLGDSGFGHESIAQQMNFPDDLGITYIFPHAPSIPVTINGGMVMPAWYDILENDISRKIDESGIEESSVKISQIIQGEIESGILPKNIMVAGFSQGGAVALHTALKYPVPLGGVIAMSTYLGAPSVLTASTSQINQFIPIFWGHGTLDPVVPLSLAQESISTLKKSGYTVSYKAYQMEHSIHPQEILDIQNWIPRHLV